MKTWSLLLYQIKTDLHLKFFGSTLGIYWAVINPLLQVAIYVFLVSFVFKVKLAGTDHPLDYGLFVLSGMGAWLAFQEALTTSAGSIIRNASVVKNINFPLELFPVSAVMCSLVSLLVSYIALAALLVASGRGVSITIVALPIVLVAQLLLTMGIAFIVAAIGAFFRDIMQVLPILLQLLMLATPIVYDKSDVPSTFQVIAKINPLFYLVDSFRQILFYGNWPNWLGILGVGGLGLLLCFAGVKAYRAVKGLFEGVV